MILTCVVLALITAAIIGMILILSNYHKATIRQMRFEDEVDFKAAQFADEMDKYKRMMAADKDLQFIICLSGTAPTADEYYAGVKDDDVLTTTDRASAKRFNSPDVLMLTYEVLRQSYENVSVIPFRWESDVL